ncbi:MAG: hypothetical protein IPK54_01155 [Dokdonella sp.]|nr:hypothetical protein [Dokdonella sp.]
MGIRLVDDDLDLSWELAVSPEVRYALRIQLQRCMCPSGVATFEERFLATLAEILDEDLIPPTASQVSYAKDICRGLRIALPEEILLFKDSMHVFLARHAPVFKEMCSQKKPRKLARSRAPKR